MTSENYNFECLGLNSREFKDMCRLSSFPARKDGVVKPVFAFDIGAAENLHSMIDYCMEHWLDYRLMLSVSAASVSFFLHFRPVNDISYDRAQEEALAFLRRFNLSRCIILDGDATVIDADGNVCAWSTFDFD